MKFNNPVVSQIIKDYSYSQRAFLPKEILIPLTQEFETIYTSLVKEGDYVKEGGVIASYTNSNNETIYLHSPLPGKILEIGQCFSPDGKKDPCIKIKFGGSFSYLGKEHPVISDDMIASSSIAKNLIDCGVINTFKTATPQNLGLQINKINSKDKKKKTNLVVRMFDEDPYRVTDSLMAKLFFEEIVKGARIVAKAINAGGIVFAIDQKLADKSFITNEKYSDIKFLEMNIKRYPCGTPREIVSAFDRGSLKRFCTFELHKTDLFTDSSTIYEVYKACALSIPSIDKYVHFTGDCLNASCLLEVKLGTKLCDVITQIGGFSKEPALIVINGLLCGNSIHSLDVPITKYVKSVEFISRNRTTDEQMNTCVNCGNCRFACPAKLSPDIIYNNTVNFKRLNENFAASVFACIECGLCNTVCPARLPLCQIITILKNKLKEE